MLKLPVRFSLLNLLLVTTIVALAIGLAIERSRSAHAKAEVDRVRNLFGELTIQDKSQVHVIAVPTSEPFHWRWHVYLPGGHDFGLYTYRGQINGGQFSMLGMHGRGRIGGQSSPNEPREILIEASLGKSPEGDGCLWITENGQFVGRVPFDTELPSWASKLVMPSEKIAGRGKTIRAKATTPLGLVMCDGQKVGGGACDDAVLIWIGEYEKNGEETFRARGILP